MQLAISDKEFPWPCEHSIEDSLGHDPLTTQSRDRHDQASANLDNVLGFEFNLRPGKLILSYIVENQSAAAADNARRRAANGLKYFQIVRVYPSARLTLTESAAAGQRKVGLEIYYIE